MATVADLSGIRQIIKPLEESGTLVQRTDEEVLPILLFVSLTGWQLSALQSCMTILLFLFHHFFFYPATQSIELIHSCGERRSNHCLCRSFSIF